MSAHWKRSPSPPSYRHTGDKKDADCQGRTSRSKEKASEGEDGLRVALVPFEMDWTDDRAEAMSIV